MQRFSSLALTGLALLSMPLLLFSERAGQEGSIDVTAVKSKAGSSWTPGGGVGAQAGDVLSLEQLEHLTDKVRMYEKAMLVTTDNMINADTTAYKRVRPRFTQTASGVKLHLARTFDQGRIETTGRKLDLAITGDGLFIVQDPDGRVLYTRDGALSRSPDGFLVTSDGLPIWPLISIPHDSQMSGLTITRNGLVNVLTSDGQAMALGTILIARFPSPSGLNAVIGQHLFAATTQSGPPIDGRPNQDGLGIILQGALEASNVSFDEERLRGVHLKRRLLHLLEVAEE